ncbi:hypothetical protein J6590_079420 [Homalodisca vitripennis]|nr:hypothetical protein J6590_079420 [Homalodisca vitripennis]
MHQLHIISPTVMPGKSDTHCFTSSLPPSCQVSQTLTASHHLSHRHARHSLLHIISPTVMPGKSGTHCFTSILPPSCQVSQTQLHIISPTVMPVDLALFGNNENCHSAARCLTVMFDIGDCVTRANDWKTPRARAGNLIGSVM